MGNFLTTTQARSTVVSILLLVAVLALVGEVGVAITMIAMSAEHMSKYRPEIIFYAALFIMAIAAVFLIAGIALAREIKRYWQLRNGTGG